MKARPGPASPSVEARRAVVGAFTLVEMLVVIGVISVLLALLAPPAASVLRGTNLAAAGQTVSGQLELARQQALTHNSSVEVRFYQFADPSVPGETAGNPSSGKFRAIQSFQVSGTGAAVPLGKVVLLPSAIMMDAGVANSSLSMSSIIAQATASGVPTTLSNPSSPIPQAGTSYDAVAFRFRPDGSTNLPLANAAGGTQPFWFVSLHASNLGDHLSTAPKDFYTVQVDCTNGNITYFRP